MNPLRALVVNPYIYDFACYDLFSKPVGALQIAAALKSSGFRIDLIDCLDRAKLNIKSSGCGNYAFEAVKSPEIFKHIPRIYKRYGISPEVFKQIIARINKPDIILVTSGMTYWYKGAFEVIDILKNKFKDAAVMLGGIYATLCYEHALRFSGADLVYKGTGMNGIINKISELTGVKLNITKGAYYMPAYELYDKLNYVTLRTSSGCPFKCSYCGWHLMEEKISQRDPEKVVSEIEYFYKKMRVKNFAFYDEALFYNPQKHIKKIIKILLEKRIRADFYTPNGLHARFLDKESAELMKKCNFVQPRLGFESSSLRRQERTGGKIYNDELSAAVKLLKSAGYSAREIGIYVLMGLPNQSCLEMENTIKYAHSLKTRVYIEEYSPIPGTPDYDRSGLSRDCDPLWHNNSVFPLYDHGRSLEFQRLKKMNHELNKRLN